MSTGGSAHEAVSTGPRVRDLHGRSPHCRRLPSGRGMAGLGASGGSGEGDAIGRGMATVEFTPNLQRILDCPTGDHAGDTVRSVLDAAFAERPKVRSYVLDDQGAVRKHVVIFVNGAQIVDRIALSDAVGPDDQLFVMQALSGG